MAAPTNVTVESNSSTQAILTWSYSGSNLISVFRAAHGGSFTELTLPAQNRIAVGTTTYSDDTAVAGTFYDYKLSDDAGATFSSVVSVVIQSCGSSSGSTQQSTGAGLPQFTTQDDINPETMQQMSQLIEAAVNTGKITGECVVCSSNGALVFNCSDGCSNFLTVLTEDINSISTLNCTNDGTIRMIVPSGATRKVKGWAAGSSLQQTPTGNQGVTGPVELLIQRKCECSEADIIFFMNTGVPCACDYDANGSKPIKNSPASTSGGSGSNTGGCTPATGLTLITLGLDGSANSNHSMGCNSASPGMKLQACGGIPPYSWSFTGNINFVGSSNGRATALPITNSGSGVAGTAYWLQCWECLDCPNPNCGAGRQSFTTIGFGCNDAITGCGLLVSPCTATPSETLMKCHNGAGSPAECAGTPPNASCGLGTICDSVPLRFNGCGSLVQFVCDKRTAPMIAGGCNPCGLIASGSGATVTVTDTVGTQVTIVIRI